MTPVQASDRPLLLWLNANPACDYEKKVRTSIALGMPVLPRDKREYWAIRIVFVRWVFGWLPCEDSVEIEQVLAGPSRGGL